MKSRTLSTWTFGLLLTGAPLIGGCAQEPAPSPQTTNPASQPAAVAATQAEANPAAITSADPETVKPVVPDKDAATERPLPANVSFSPALNEVAKMAQAGVEDSVMLAFINNSSSTFNLGSDQVIYLNDLGLSGSVITAMIQRDKELSSASGQVATASTVPTPAPASAAEQATGTAPAQNVAAAEAGTQNQYAPGYAGPEPETQPTVVNYNYFYDSLAPYGTWVNVGGYGWCWQPTVTVIHAGWSPYCDGGRWLYSDLGWYWQSDYTWGSIPFHYGRWFSHPRWGWCWWPDTVWAPSWVTWRYANDYCGWAPLPPYSGYAAGFGLTYYGGSVGVSFGFGLNAGCYTYVPWNRFCDYRPYRYRVPRERMTHIHDRSLAINNIIQGDHNTIINRGIAVDRAANLAHSEIRRVAVRDLPTGSARNIRSDRPQIEGGRLVVYRPAPPALPARGSNPAGEARIGPASASPSTSHFPAPRPDFSGRLTRTPSTSGADDFRARPTRTDVFAPAESSRSTGPRPAFTEHGGRDDVRSVRTDAGTPSPAPTAKPAPIHEVKPGTTPQPSTSAFTSDHSRRPSPDRNADATAPRDKAPPGSINLIGRGNEADRGREPLKPQNVAPAANNERAASSRAVTSQAGPTTFWQDKVANPSASRPSFSQNAPAPQPTPPAMAPTFSRPSTPARVEPGEVRVIRQEPAVVSRPVIRERSPEPRPDAPPPRVSVPAPSRAEAIAAPPARAASPPPPAASSASDRSSKTSDSGGRRGRDANER